MVAAINALRGRNLSQPRVACKAVKNLWCSDGEIWLIGSQGGLQFLPINYVLGDQRAVEKIFRYSAHITL